MDFAHITTIKKQEDKEQPSTDSNTFIRKASFAAETEANLENIPISELQSVSTLAGNLQGGTFAQRARAAELQAARARKELKSDIPPTSSPSPRRLITLKMPRRQKWTPLDLTSTADPPSVEAKNKSSNNTSSAKQPSPEEKLVVNEETFPELNLAYDVGGQLSNDQNSHNRSDKLTSRLYGSHPSSTLQSQDLAEYPAELEARITTEMPPAFESSVYKDSAQNSHSNHRAEQNTQIFASRNDNMPDNQEARQQPQRRELPFGITLGDSEIERELYEAFTSGYGPPQVLPQVSENIFEEMETHLRDPRENFAPRTTKSYLNGSFPAVRGTPAAYENTSALKSLPPKSQFKPLEQGSYILPKPLPQGQVIRKTSEQEKDFLRRQLKSVIDENRAASQSYHQRNGAISTTPGQSFDDFLSMPRQHIYSPPVIAQQRPTLTSHQVSGHSQFNHNNRHTGIWVPDYSYQGQRIITPPAQTAAELRKEDEQSVHDWWIRDNRVSLREKRSIEEFVRAERLAIVERGFMQEAAEDETKIKDPSHTYTNKEMVDDLLIPALANLASYKTDHTKLNPFSKPPSWAIDHTPGGNNSFFSQQWGTPPQRVGRDPRYRAMQHDGRSSVFEDPTGRFPREEFSHGRGR